MHSKKNIIYVSILFYFLSLIYGVNNLLAKENITSPEIFLSILNNRPEDLNKKELKYFKINDKKIIFKDQTFSETDFSGVTLNNVVMKNVTFNNCWFAYSSFLNVTMENVTFNDCWFSGSEEDKQAAFDALKMENVTFNKCEFRAFLTKVSAEGGSIIFKNISFKNSYDNHKNTVLVEANNINLRIDNCEFKDSILYRGNGKYEATMYATNSTFRNMNLTGAKFFKTIWYENCIFNNTIASLGLTTVLKDSYLNAGFQNISQASEKPKKVYVSKCVIPKRWAKLLNGKYFWSGTVFNSDQNNIDVYIYGNPKQKEIALSLNAGKYYIFDADITVLDLRNYKNELAAEPDLKAQALSSIELNLKNVTIKGEPWPNENEYPNIDWEGITITKGIWNNVKIYPVVNMKDARVENLLVHNLQFPKGVPWINDNENTFAPYKKHKAPLDIPKPPLPTLKEVGIVDPLK